MACQPQQLAEVGYSADAPALPDHGVGRCLRRAFPLPELREARNDRFRQLLAAMAERARTPS